MLCVLSRKLGMEAAEVGIVEQLATALLALSTRTSFGFQLHAGTAVKDCLADSCGLILKLEPLLHCLTDRLALNGLPTYKPCMFASDSLHNVKKHRLLVSGQTNIGIYMCMIYPQMYNTYTQIARGGATHGRHMVEKPFFLETETK